jgi:hypothetical protein
MEQYMMYKKAMTFGNADIAKKILETNDVAKIKALGRQVHNYNETVWNGVRQIVVYNGLLEKFQQNHELKEKLLSTKDAVLAECAVKDKIWGIGLSMTDPSRHNMNNWAGSNLLGFALMEVRAAFILSLKARC